MKKDLLDCMIPKLKQPAKWSLEVSSITECDLHLMWQVYDLLESEQAFWKLIKHKCGHYLYPFVYIAESCLQSSYVSVLFEKHV